MRTIVGSLPWTRALAAAALCSACGRVGFDPQATSDAGADAAASDVPAPAVPPLGGLVDDFEDGLLAPFWFTYADAAGTKFAETGGSLVITMADQRTDSYAGYVSQTGADLRDAGCWAELAGVPTTPKGADCYLVVSDGVNMGIGFTIDDTELRVVDMSGATAGSFSSTDPRARWLRIREGGGSLHFDESADGRVWLELASLPDPPFVTMAKVNLGGGTYQVGATASSCAFAGMNTAPP